MAPAWLDFCLSRYGSAMVRGTLTCVKSVIADIDFQHGAAPQGAFDAGRAAGLGLHGANMGWNGEEAAA